MGWGPDVYVTFTSRCWKNLREMWDMWLKAGWRAQWFSRKEGILIIWCLIWCGPEINSYWNELFGVLLLGYPKKWFPTPGCALSKMLFDVCPGWSPLRPRPTPQCPCWRSMWQFLFILIWHYAMDQHKMFVTPWSDNASDFFLETFLQNWIKSFLISTILSSAISPP